MSFSLFFFTSFVSWFYIFESINQHAQSENTVKIASATVIHVTMEEYVKNRVVFVFVRQGLWETNVK